MLRVQPDLPLDRQPDVSVRPARPGDVPAVARVQARSWRAGYAGVLPGPALDALADDASLQASWRAAVEAAPSPRHRVLVACAGPEVVGLLACAPAGPADAEVLVLAVDPAAQRAGHGSRLLAAAVELARGDGVRLLTSWVDERDQALLSLLAASGWAREGARRTLDMYDDGSVVVEQVRLHTDVTPT